MARGHQKIQAQQKNQKKQEVCGGFGGGFIIDELGFFSFGWGISSCLNNVLTFCLKQTPHSYLTEEPGSRPELDDNGQHWQLSKLSFLM